MSSRPTRGTARLAAILDALPDALLLVNSNGTVVDANDAAVRSLQAPGTSLVGRGVLDLLPEFDPSRIPGSMRPRGKNAAGEEADDDAPVRMTARRTDGSSFTVEVQASEFEDDGRTQGNGSTGSYYGSSSLSTPSPSDRELLLIVVRDLSARLEVESELRRQHKQTEMILRAAAEGVVGVDTDGRVVLVNPAAAHILGHRAGELGGQELLPLVMHSRADGSPLPAEESPLADTLRSGRRHRVHSATLWRKDGQPVSVELSTAPVRDGDQLVGAVMTFTDRSAYLSLNSRHEHLTAVLEQELRKPLDRLNDTLEQLARDPAGQLWPEANWVLRRLADECRRTSNLVDGVLAYQRFDAAAEAGKEQLHRQPVALDKVIAKAVEAATGMLGEGRVEFAVHPASVEVAVDAERLAVALGHLIADVADTADDADPAAKGELYGMAVGVASGLAGRRHGARSAGGAGVGVVIAAAQRGEVARIEVRGPGAGSGPIHLPIARGIVERHGGVLQSHELPGRQGRTYVVELPLDPANAAVQRPLPAPGDNATAILPDLPLELPARPAPAPAPAPAAAPDTAEAAPAATGTPAQGTDRSRRRNRLPAPEVVRPPRAMEAEAEAEAAAQQAQQAQMSQQAQHPQPGASDEFPGLIGAPVYPGLEHALPPAGSVIAPEPRRQTSAGNGRRRRLALGPAAGDENPTPQSAQNPQHPQYGQNGTNGQFSLNGQVHGEQEAGATGPGALEPVPPAMPMPSPLPPSMATPAQHPAEPLQPMGLPEMSPDSEPSSPPAPPAPFGGRFALGPASTPAPASPAVPVPQQARPRGGSHAALPLPPAPTPASGSGSAGGTFGGRSGVMSLSQSPLQSVQTPPRGTELPRQSQPAPQPGQPAQSGRPGSPVGPEEDGPGTESRLEFIAGADYPTMIAPASDGRPRRLLVWPEPDPSTRQALKDRGYRPIIVSSREEVDAQVAGYPAALFVDPLTGPITRTALQSLRTAAGDANVPVLVTAGLGQATPEAAYGADPAVLLRALAPRDSDRHAPRVLLVEQDPHIAAAFTASLERRGMHVEHASSENDAVSRASSVQPNLVVMDLMLIRRRRMGIVDWLRSNNRLFRTPLVVYTSVDGPEQRAGLRSGETVLFLAERSTSPEVQARIVDLLGKIGSLAEA
ncbi:PAS domain S-box-containing protein [Streptacidiphilus sp. MAP12-20]|uniref:hybrid sensor histidine kinase/response regulator n=1 Tax=Streptacidiphilus sp. MAP12-20 TaxID=3156299 RepID=UPI003510F037